MYIYARYCLFSRDFLSCFWCLHFSVSEHVPGNVLCLRMHIPWLLQGFAAASGINLVGPRLGVGPVSWWTSRGSSGTSSWTLDASVFWLCTSFLLFPVCLLTAWKVCAWPHGSTMLNLEELYWPMIPKYSKAGRLNQLYIHLSEIGLFSDAMWYL